MKIFTLVVGLVVGVVFLWVIYGIVGFMILLIVADGHDRVFKFLLRIFGVNAVSLMNQQLLICAIRHNQQEIVNLLLLAGADPNSALKFAATLVDSVYVKQLLKFGAKTDPPSDRKETALTLAVRYRCKGNIKLLIRAGAIISGITIQEAKKSYRNRRILKLLQWQQGKRRKAIIMWYAENYLRDEYYVNTPAFDNDVKSMLPCLWIKVGKQ